MSQHIRHLYSKGSYPLNRYYSRPFVTVHSVTSNSSVFNAECTHFAKIMQNGAVKLGFLTKNLSKILEFGVGVKSNGRSKHHAEKLLFN